MPRKPRLYQYYSQEVKDHALRMARQGSSCGEIRREIEAWYAVKPSDGIIRHWCEKAGIRPGRGQRTCLGHDISDGIISHYEVIDILREEYDMSYNEALICAIRHWTGGHLIHDDAITRPKFKPGPLSRQLPPVDHKKPPAE